MRNEAEKLALSLLSQIFQNPQYIDDIIDIQSGSISIEVKSCKEIINDGKWKRSGRFWITKDQHEYLLDNKGFYLFVLFCENGETKAKLVPAWALKWNNGEVLLLTWKKVFNKKYLGEREL